MIPLDADAFWSVIHGPEYEALVAEALGLHEYGELDRREERDAVYRRIRVSPETPAALRVLLRRAAGVDSLSYVEEQWRSRTRREVRFRMVPSVLAERSRIEGTVRVEPRTDATCTRILEGVVEVGLPIVGGLLERAIVANTVDGYGKSAAVVERLPAPTEPGAPRARRGGSRSSGRRSGSAGTASRR